MKKWKGLEVARRDQMGFENIYKLLAAYPEHKAALQRLGYVDTEKYPLLPDYMRSLPDDDARRMFLHNVIELMKTWKDSPYLCAGDFWHEAAADILATFTLERRFDIYIELLEPANQTLDGRLQGMAYHKIGRLLSGSAVNIASAIATPDESVRVNTRTIGTKIYWSEERRHKITGAVRTRSNLACDWRVMETWHPTPMNQ